LRSEIWAIWFWFDQIVESKARLVASYPNPPATGGRSDDLLSAGWSRKSDTQPVFNTNIYATFHPIPYPTNPFSNVKMCYLTVPREHQLFLMSRLAPLVTKRTGKDAAAISNKSWKTYSPLGPNISLMGTGPGEGEVYLQELQPFSVSRFQLAGWIDSMKNAACNDPWRFVRMLFMDFNGCICKGEDFME
jgi:hypothetical protein